MHTTRSSEWSRNSSCSVCGQAFNSDCRRQGFLLLNQERRWMRIWCNTAFTPEAAQLLGAGTSEHELVLAARVADSILHSSPADAGFATANVVLGQPDPEALLAGSSELRWVHLTTAGYTRYDRDDLRGSLRERGIPLTTSSQVFAEPCAQHLMAMMLGLARQLPVSLQTQLGDRGWRQDERRLASRLLGGETAILYGFGSIATRLVELLAPYGMRLIGVRRRPVGDEPIETLTEAAADARLGEADHVLDILPEHPGTRGYFNRHRFALMKPGARFYNIGRGPTVDQEALLEALGNHLDAAFLDVTDPEPLPPEHPLWKAPNCWITPHSGGGHRQESLRLAAHFLANLRLLESGQGLLDQVI